MPRAGRAAQVTPPARAEARKLSLASNATATFATNIAVALLSVGSVLLVSRALGPSGRGSVALLTTIANLTHYVATLGVQEANANVGGAEPHLRPALATNSLLLGSGFGLAAVGVLGGAIVAFPGLDGHVAAGPCWLALGSIPVVVTQDYLARLAQSEYRFALSNAAWLSVPAVTVIVNGTLAAVGSLSVGSAVAAWVAGQVVGTGILVAGFALRRGFGRPDKALARRTIVFGAKVHPGTVMMFGNYRLDAWLLGAIAGARELGLYSVAVAWAEALFFLPTAVGLAQRPDLVRDTRAGATQRTLAAFRVAMLATLPLVVGMMLFAPMLCAGLFGEEFRASAADLRVLAPGAFAIVAVKLLGNSLTAQGRPLLQTAAIGISLVATVVLDVLLIPRHGAMGASIASSIAYTIGGLAVATIFQRALGTRTRNFVPGRGDARSLLASARSARAMLQVRAGRRRTVVGSREGAS